MKSMGVIQCCLLWVLLILALPVSAAVQCTQHPHSATAKAGNVPLFHADAIVDIAGAVVLAPLKTVAVAPYGSAYITYQPSFSHSHCADHGHDQCTACCAAVLASSLIVPRHSPLQLWSVGRFPDFAGRHPPPLTKPPSSFPIAKG